jgi:hypothetical protein
LILFIIHIYIDAYENVKSKKQNYPNEYDKTIISLWKPFFHVYECNEHCKCKKEKCCLTFTKLINPVNYLKSMKEKFIVKRIRKSRVIGNGKMISTAMWGLFTKVNIPKNSFVIEYAGEVSIQYNKNMNIDHHK